MSAEGSNDHSPCWTMSQKVTTGSVHAAKCHFTPAFSLFVALPAGRMLDAALYVAGNLSPVLTVLAPREKHMFANVHQIINAIWLILSAVWIVTAFRLKPSVRTVDIGSRILPLMVLGCAFVLLFTDRPPIALLEARSFPALVAVVGTGIALTAIGVAFAIVARLYLGRNWSAAPKIRRDHGLVRRGPYSLVRHPIYTGMLVAALGTAIAFGQLRHLFALPLLIIGFWLQARSEERLLLSEFGERYCAYRLDVRGAIIPYLL